MLTQRQTPRQSRDVELRNRSIAEPRFAAPGPRPAPRGPSPQKPGAAQGQTRPKSTMVSWKGRSIFGVLAIAMKAADGHVAVMEKIARSPFHRRLHVPNRSRFRGGRFRKCRPTCASCMEGKWGAELAERKGDRLHFCGGKRRQTLVSAEHHWDVAAQTDHVKWKGKM